MAIGIMMVLSITVATVVQVTSSGSRSARRDAASANAYHLAEAGLAEAYSKLDAAANPTVGTTLSSTTFSLNGGSVTYLGTYSQPDWSLTSTATVPNPSDPTAGSVQRTLTQTVTIQPIVPGATAPEWDRVFQASAGCLTIPDTVTMRSSVTAVGDLCLEGTAAITGTASKVEVGDDVTVTGVNSSTANNGTGSVNGSGWSNPTRIRLSDDSLSASGNIGPNTNSAIFNSHTYGFSIPSGATILGIQVRIERRASATNSVNDQTVQLLRAGAAVGSNKAGAGYWGTSDSTATYGSSSDLWGTTWTPADINLSGASGFGVRFRAFNDHNSSNRTASIDQIRIDVTYQPVSAAIGTAGTPVSRVEVVGTCQYGAAPARTPCSQADGVYASTVTTTPPNLTKPSIDFNYWYANAKPGPMHPCTSGSIPGGFDNNSVYDKSLPDYGNANEDLDFTPTNTSFDCQYVENGNLVGRISWDHVTHQMNILGTIFVDGNIRFDKDGTLINYDGRGILYAGGDIEFDEVVCAGGNGTNNCHDGDMTAWDPNTNMMIIVAGGSAEYDQGDNYEDAAFQGVMYAKDTCHIHQDFRSSGPIICDNIVIDNAEGNGLPTFFSWPPLQTLIAGQMYGSFATAADYKLLLGPEKG